ncbi:hypothetical protein F2P56_015008 [Juglans regia]|uniref:Reverse transcriptase Ty1/copia-type domain-containing protein n=1 Tax=Juglans regia TaxID=51240 RepID=A0A834CUE1_JUGRE|nr:hypothetical protein F2P56_015008 [Juglans regia]
MTKELDALSKNHIWSLADLPSGKSVIGYKGLILLLLFVDDMIITSDDFNGIKELKDFLNQQFEMKGLCHLSYFFDLEIISSTDGFYLTYPSQGTLFHGLHFFAQSLLVLQAYSDADWAGDPIDRRSTIGHCFLLGSSLISWLSKKQIVVFRSNTEAKYLALANTTTELNGYYKI